MMCVTPCKEHKYATVEHTCNKRMTLRTHQLARCHQLKGQMFY